jgi:hypothetical protein
VPEAQGKLHVRTAEGLPGWNNVQHGQLIHFLSMVERHAIGTAPAAVMADDRKFLEAKMAHHCDLVQGHDTLGIRQVIRRGWRFAALAIAAQVRSDDREIPGKQRRDLVPHGMRLRMSVQE